MITIFGSLEEGDEFIEAEPAQLLSVLQKAPDNRRTGGLKVFCKIAANQATETSSGEVRQKTVLDPVIRLLV